MIEKIEALARKNNARIAIGVSKDPRQRSITLAGAEQAQKKGLVRPILIGDKIRNNTELECIQSSEPARDLINLLSDEGIDGIVRGSLVANEFISEFVNNSKMDPKNIFKGRLALIQSSIFNKTCIIAPIGIDEGFSIDSKKFIVKEGIKFLNKLNLVPKISIMAAGIYPTDIGRHPIADQTIKDSEQILNSFNQEYEIFSDGILINKSLAQGSNFIISIDGITGNIIYRTLINLSSEWFSFGALFSNNIPKYENKIIIDTSQYASLHDYRRALTLTSALAKQEI